jgi:hypothetical protein
MANSVILCFAAVCSSPVQQPGKQSVSKSLNTMDPLALAQNFMKIVEKAGRLQVV